MKKLIALALVLVVSLSLASGMALGQSDTQTDTEQNITAEDFNKSEVKTIIYYSPADFNRTVLIAVGDKITYNMSLSDWENMTQADQSSKWLIDAMNVLDGQEVRYEYKRTDNASSLFTINSSQTQTPTPTETETGQNEAKTGNNTTETTNETQTTPEANKPPQTVNKNDSGNVTFNGSVSAGGSRGASTQNMYVNVTHYPNASTDGYTAELLAGSTAGNVYLLETNFPESGAVLRIFSERDVTVTIAWQTDGDRFEDKPVKLKKGVNVIQIDADGTTGSISVPVPERPTNEGKRFTKGFSLDGLVGTITFKHVLGTVIVILMGSMGVLYWLDSWFKRNVLNSYHKLSESNLLKLFKP